MFIKKSVCCLLLGASFLPVAYRNDLKSKVRGGATDEKTEKNLIACPIISG